MKNPNSIIFRRRFGFTLAELLIVLVILTILMSLTFSGVRYALRSSYERKSKIQIEAIKAALESFHADHGAYPLSTNAEEGSSVLYSALSGDTNFDGEITDADTELDSWFSGGASGMKAKSYLDDLVNADGKQRWTETDNGKIYIIDAFENRIQYYANPSAPNQMYNAPNNYDLWSFGLDEQGDSEEKEEQWIKNW